MFRKQCQKSGQSRRERFVKFGLSLKSRVWGRRKFEEGLHIILFNLIYRFFMIYFLFDDSILGIDIFLWNTYFGERLDTRPALSSFFQLFQFHIPTHIVSWKVSIHENVLIKVFRILSHFALWWCGPYTILNCIQASFNQGHEKFGETRGIQCTCIALYNICFSVFKDVSLWNKNDLEYIVEKGDELYKSQNTLRYLSCLELPRNVQVEHLQLPVVFKDNFCSTITKEVTIL